jgi:hypothetical protein
MGKGVLILVFGILLAGATVLYQSRNTALETTRQQTGYEEGVLAREIARSAYNIALEKAQQAGNDLEQAIANVNGTTEDGSPDYNGKMTGAYQGGTYEAQAFLIDGQNLGITATGFFGEASFTVNSKYAIALLEVKERSLLTVEFVLSWAGYCSAIYLQQIPDGYVAEEDTLPAPQMIFASGHYHPEGTRTTPSDIVLEAGTRINFFIAVDTDCSEEGEWVPEGSFDASTYDWIHNALDTGVEELEDMQEGLYAMIEQDTENDQQWRIGFEDLRVFSEAQHNDVKAHGYGEGNAWDATEETYHGTGWEIGDDGFRVLQDFGDRPDFEDQVILVTLVPCGSDCPVDPS